MKAQSIVKTSKCHILFFCFLLFESLLNLQDHLVEAAVDVRKDTDRQKSSANRPIDNSGIRDRSHITSILQLHSRSFAQKAGLKTRQDQILNELSGIYHSDIEPLEELYHFHDLNLNSVTDGEILAKPLVLFLGPWSTGKSTMINYLLEIDKEEHALYTGAEPTTTDFPVLMHGNKYKAVEGLVLATDPKQRFSDLEKYGQAFLEKFQGLEMPRALLERVTIVDSPGIIENRKQQERGYPFNEVMKWFIDRANLIFVVFDPSKLDVGTELESIFKKLKGRESQIRIILNKADLLSSQELMRVYGALFWNFAPLINVVEPPRVYVGSFWAKDFHPSTNHNLFLKEEISLLHDLHEVVANSLENRVASIRKHANNVYMHAIIVDKLIEVFNRERAVFGDNEAKWVEIVQNLEHYVYQPILSLPYISKYDLPQPERYEQFFRINSLTPIGLGRPFHKPWPPGGNYGDAWRISYIVLKHLPICHTIQQRTMVCCFSRRALDNSGILECPIASTLSPPPWRYILSLNSVLRASHSF